MKLCNFQAKKKKITLLNKITQKKPLKSKTACYVRIWIF